MQAIIIGENRAEFVKIPTSALNNHFIKTRGEQLYMIYPDGMTRMRIFKDGIEQPSEEVIVYAENSIKPHVTRNLNYAPEFIMGRIDIHKRAKSDNLLNKGLFYKVGNIAKSIYPYGTLVLTGLIVLMAFLFG